MSLSVGQRRLRKACRADTRDNYVHRTPIEIKLLFIYCVMYVRVSVLLRDLVPRRGCTLGHTKLEPTHCTPCVCIRVCQSHPTV